MFRELRRKSQELSQEENAAVLDRATAGILAVHGHEGYPYAVPMSFVYGDGKIYLHCAKTGHKLDAIAQNDKVSFCVIDADKIVPEEYTTYFRSVILFGKARILQNLEEKRNALGQLAAKYSPDQGAARTEAVERSLEGVCMVEIAVEHMCGKEARELSEARRGGESV